MRVHVTTCGNATEWQAVADNGAFGPYLNVACPPSFMPVLGWRRLAVGSREPLQELLGLSYGRTLGWRGKTTNLQWGLA